VTEKNFNKVLTGNLEHLHGFLDRKDLGIPATPALIRKVHLFVTNTLKSEEQISLGKLTDVCDREFKLSAGSAYVIFCHLLSNHQIAIDLTKRLDKMKRLFLLDESQKESAS
jgi:hypothetical protein